MTHWGKVNGDCCKFCVHWQSGRLKCKRVGKKVGPFYLCDLFEKKQEQLLLFQDESTDIPGAKKGALRSGGTVVDTGGH